MFKPSATFGRKLKNKVSVSSQELPQDRSDAKVASRYLSKGSLAWKPFQYALFNEHWIFALLTSRHFIPNATRNGYNAAMHSLAVCHLWRRCPRHWKTGLEDVLDLEQAWS